MSLGSFLSNLVGKIHSAAVEVSKIFVDIFGQKAATDFGNAALGLLKSDLGQIVTAEVEQLAPVNNLTGVEKAAQAQVAIAAKAKALGISTSNTIINMLIELAVQFVTGKLTAVSVPVVPTSTN